MKYIPYIFSAILLIISIITFIFYGSDKSKARKSERRTPERTLLGLSFFGGALGGLSGMLIFRHKTQKLRFWIVNIIGFLWQIAMSITLFIFIA